MVPGALAIVVARVFTIPHNLHTGMRAALRDEKPTAGIDSTAQHPPVSGRRLTSHSTVHFPTAAKLLPTIHDSLLSQRALRDMMRGEVAQDISTSYLDVCQSSCGAHTRRRRRSACSGCSGTELGG